MIILQVANYVFYTKKYLLYIKNYICCILRTVKQLYTQLNDLYCFHKKS